MIFTISPLEVLAAFAIAFVTGILSGLGLVRYSQKVWNDAQKAAYAA